MNPVSAYLILLLILLYFGLAVVPTANISSVASDTAGLTGVAGFTFGNMGLVMFLCLIVTIFYWMGTK